MYCKERSCPLRHDFVLAQDEQEDKIPLMSGICLKNLKTACPEDGCKFVSNDFERLQKKTNGFTLIEVLGAMAIMTGTVYVMSDLHIRSMFRLIREREKFLKFYIVKNALAQQMPLLCKEFKPTKPERVEDEAVANQLTLGVEVLEPNPKSPLKDILGDQLALVQATGTWKNGPFDYDIKLVSFAQREVWLEDPKP
jgi:prepilin-type N-terminal cleavage/methylation domain-containing protein